MGSKYISKVLEGKNITLGTRRGTVLSLSLAKMFGRYFNVDKGKEISFLMKIL